jgi:hypothetical protein
MTSCCAWYKSFRSLNIDIDTRETTQGKTGIDIATRNKILSSKQ